ncbi:MAG: hypothetical protein Solivirus2_41 [Solivirus sp.]|uniref:Uncharacterized protein n=1 Tax=Solivirus sp. TaxID=2487772 RepID=A0A3G5AFK5_9VIRU|nr:MAG: hypothetical protein Solivirus2_41 [Solivirus sp.]
MEFLELLIKLGVLNFNPPKKIRDSKIQLVQLPIEEFKMEFVKLLLKYEEKISITWTSCSYDEWNNRYRYVSGGKICNSSTNSEKKYSLPVALKLKITTIDQEIFKELRKCFDSGVSKEYSQVQISELSITERRSIKYKYREKEDELKQEKNKREIKRKELFAELKKINIHIDSWHLIEELKLDDDHYDIEKVVWKPGELHVPCNNKADLYKELEKAGLLDKYCSDAYKKGIL